MLRITKFLSNRPNLRACISSDYLLLDNISVKMCVLLNGLFPFGPLSRPVMCSSVVKSSCSVGSYVDERKGDGFVRRGHCVRSGCPSIVYPIFSPGERYYHEPS